MSELAYLQDFETPPAPRSRYIFVKVDLSGSPCISNMTFIFRKILKR